MRKKRFEDIHGLTPDFVEKIIEIHGRPDYFLESAEASMVGMPDVYSDPEAKRVVKGLKKRIKSGTKN